MAILDGKKIKLFTLSANPALAQEIANACGLPLSDCEVLHFADGEINVSINETVRGFCYSTNLCTCKRSPNGIINYV